MDRPASEWYAAAPCGKRQRVTRAPRSAAKEDRMNITRIRTAALLLIGLVQAGLWGCAATQVALSKKDLDVQTKMSESVFLDPVSPDKMSIYLKIRNTS